jgi:uncharacterized protein (TIGR02001 family)
MKQLKNGVICSFNEQVAEFVTLLRRPLSDDFRHRTSGSPAAGQAKLATAGERKRSKKTGFPMRGKTIKATILGAGALALMAGTAIAADMPVYTKAPPPMVGKAPVGSMFKVEYEGWVASNYVFRGTTQSDRGPSAGASATAVWNDAFYLGIAGAAISWPDNAAFGPLSDPSAEIDLFGGLRWSHGKWSFDAGAIYYYYPKEVNFQSDFWEVYFNAEYAVSDQLSVGGSIAYSPDYLKYGIDGTAGALNFTWTVPTSYQDLSFYVSGELGYVWLGATPSGGAFIPDYAHWNAGFGWNWKTLTLDLRYHDTDLSASGCQAIWNSHGSPGISKWCSPAYVAKLSFAGSTAD